MVLHGSQTVIGRRYVIVDLNGLLLETGASVAQHVEEDGDLEHGLDKAYTAHAAGDLDIAIPEYAAATIAFVAGTQITDTADGLGMFDDAGMIGDEIVVRGSADNDGVYTIAAGGGIGIINTVEATSLEALGPYVSICKRDSISQNMVFDRNTGLLWLQLTSKAKHWGTESDGLMVWYDATLDCELHPVGADHLSMIPPNVLRILGGDTEEDYFHVGDAIVCTVFGDAVNLLPGYRILSVTVNGADLDLVIDPANNTLIAEADVNGVIKLVCSSAFAYAAAACAANLGGYDDWRVPNLNELLSLLDFGLVAQVTPDVATFPGWPYDGDGGWVWASTTDAATTANAYQTGGDDGTFVSTVKTGTANVALVRGG